MTTLTEKAPSSSFLVADFGIYSYESGTVASGQTLDAGEAVMLSGGELVTWAGGTDANCIGFMVAAVDASGAAMPGAYLARGAIVREDGITYPAATLTLLEADMAALSPPILIR